MRWAQIQKAPCCGAFLPVRPGRLELPPGIPRTRPSTLRVYQFRHRRVCGGPIIGTRLGSATGLDAVRSVFYLVRTHVRPNVNRAAGGRCQVVDLKLTKRQQEIFDFIKQYSGRHGYPPTVRDIGKAIGLTSSSTVHAHLANLEKLGLVRRDPTKPRALELLGEAARKLTGQAGLPVVGRVAAGSPILAEENSEDYVEVPPIAGGDDGEYVLRVAGDSMVDAGILDGDYVIVHRQETAD